MDLPAVGEKIKIGKGRIIQEGRGVAILSFGTRLGEVLKACEKLRARGITPTVADARFAKPLDKDMIFDLAARHDAMIAIEEGSIGGFGSHVMQLLSDGSVFDQGFKFRSMVMPDEFIDQASAGEMYAQAGLGIEDIERKVLQVMDISEIQSKSGSSATSA